MQRIVISYDPKNIEDAEKAFERKVTLITEGWRVFSEEVSPTGKLTIIMEKEDAPRFFIKVV